MSVISIRLNKNEEKMLKHLSTYFEEDKSSLIKHSLRELYEDLRDKKEIEKFEKREKKGNIKFVASDKILKEI